MMQRFALLLLFALSACAATDSSSTTLRRPTTRELYQRRELGVTDYWYTLLNLLHVPCPHDHSENHPKGHCAHKSHHHHHHSGGGGSHSSSGSSSSSSSSGCVECDTCDGDDTDCQDSCVDSCDSSSSSVWGSDGHDDAVWGSDGYDDDGNSTGWGSDGWGSDGWSNGWQNSYSSATSGYHSADSSNNAKVWGIGALVACVVGAAVFVVVRKRKQEQANNEGDIPGDVYSCEEDPSVLEMGTAQTRQSRAQSIKSSFSRAGASFRSKFSKRSRSNNAAENDADNYLAPPVENDEYSNEGEGYVVM